MKLAKSLKLGFYVAGLTNILGTLTLSACFTNEAISKADPEVMSNFGLGIIILWGLAYITIAKNYHNTVWLVGVFAIEKLAYSIHWTKWILNNEISALYEQSLSAGTFYSIYGISDWLFFIFFSYVFIKTMKK